MKLLVVVDDINYHGGAHVSTMEMINSMISIGCQVDVLTGTAPSELIKRKLKDCRFYKMPIPRSGFRWFVRGCITRLKLGWYPVWTLDPFKKWREHANQYDLVASIGEPSFYRWFVASLDKPRKVMFIHTDYMAWRKTALEHTRWDNVLYRKFDCIAVVGDSNAKGFAECYPFLSERVVSFRNIILKHNVDCKSEKKVFCDDKRIKIMTIARLEEEAKQPRLYLKVAKRLCDLGIDFEWSFFGDGSLLKELRSEVKDLGIGGLLKFEGWNANVIDKIPNADLFVLLSSYEGLPNVIYESLMAGTPVLSTNVGGISEQIIQGQTGWLVENEENAIVEGLSMLLKNPEEIENAKERLKDYFYDNDVVVEEYKQILCV